MKKNTTKMEHEINRSFHKTQRGETAIQRKELVFNLSSPPAEKLAAVVYDIFKGEFSLRANVTSVQTESGYWKIRVTDKLQKERSTPQIEVTVTKDGKFNVHLNDYGHDEQGNSNYDKWYYFGDKLTGGELIAEMKSFNAFLSEQGMSENSKLTKEEYFNPEDY